MTGELVRRVAFFTGFAGVAAISLAVMGGTTSTDSGYHQQRATQVSPVAALIEAHDCWVGEGPGGVIPGHAIYTLPGETPTLGPSQIGFDIWLNGKPGRLHAFCP